MRERAIIGAAVREMLPFAGLAALVGVGILGLAVVENSIASWDSANALAAVPIAALWGGVAIGGTTPAAALHLMLRPVSRRRLLLLRMAALWSVLMPVAVALAYLESIAFLPDGTSPVWCAAATMLCTAVGAQAGLASRSEPIALGAAALLLAAYFVPVQIAVALFGLSWARVEHFLGGWIAVPAVLAIVAAFVPVVVAWQRWWPRRSRQVGLRVYGLGLACMLAVIGVTVVPPLVVATRPEHGELLVVVGATPRGILVATGTRRIYGNDRMDGIVEIDLEGRRTTVWDRRAAVGGLPAPYVDATQRRSRHLWVAIEEEPGRGSTWVELADLDGLDRPSSWPTMAKYSFPALMRAEQKHGMFTVALGPPQGPFIMSRGVRLMADTRRMEFIKVRPSMILDPNLDGGIAIARGRIWMIEADSGELRSRPVPWEVP